MDYVNDVSKYIDQIRETSKGADEGSPFYQYLVGSECDFDQIPSPHPIDWDTYKKWKVEVANKDPGNAFDGELSRVSFQQFIRGFEVQMAGVEDKMSGTEGLPCVTSFYRRQSGDSVDQVHKSFTWMFQIFQHFMTWSRPLDSKEDKYPRLRRCDGQPTSDRCVADPKTVVFVLEDVSYSGDELVNTVKEILECESRPEHVFASTVYYGEEAIQYGFGPSEKVDGLSMPWDLAGEAHETYLLREAKGSDSPGHQGRWVYFDHKMADATSLGQYNVQFMRGAILGGNGVDAVEIIPFIKGCIETHRCSLQNKLGWSSRIWRLECGAKLNCPYAPYKDQENMIKLAGTCGCDEAVVEEIRGWVKR